MILDHNWLARRLCDEIRGASVLIKRDVTISGSVWFALSTVQQTGLEQLGLQQNSTSPSRAPEFKAVGAVEYHVSRAISTLDAALRVTTAASDQRQLVFTEAAVHALLAIATLMQENQRAVSSHGSKAPKHALDLMEPRSKGCECGHLDEQHGRISGVCYAEIDESTVCPCNNFAPVSDALPVATLDEEAWGIIANVSGGDWTQQSAEWQAAAARFRDSYVASASPPPQHNPAREEIEREWAALTPDERAYVLASDADHAE